MQYIAEISGMCEIQGFLAREQLYWPLQKNPSVTPPPNRLTLYSDCDLSPEENCYFPCMHAWINFGHRNGPTEFLGTFFGHPVSPAVKVS